MRGIKRDLTDGGIRVPFVARWPGKIPAGRTSDFVGSFADVMPTVAELAGAAVPPGVDGISIVPELTGRSAGQKQHEYLYWEFHEGGFGQAVRIGDWKAIRTNKKPTKFGALPGQKVADGPSAANAPAKTELYDLKTDVGEEKDVAAAHPDVVAKAEEVMRTARTPWEPMKEPATKPAGE